MLWRRGGSGTAITDDSDVGTFVLCPPDDPDPINCDPAPPPPPPPDTTSDPEPEPVYLVGASYVQPWGFGYDGHSYEYVDFGSYTAAREPIAYVEVTGYSYIDGWPEQVISHSTNESTFAGVGWTYWAGYFGYAFAYQQQGAHDGCEGEPGAYVCAPRFYTNDYVFDFAS